MDDSLFAFRNSTWIGVACTYIRELFSILIHPLLLCHFSQCTPLSVAVSMPNACLMMLRSTWRVFCLFFIFQLLFIIHAPQSRLNVAPLVVVVAIVCCCCCCCCAVSAPLSDTSLALALRCAAEKKLISRALWWGGGKRERERERGLSHVLVFMLMPWVSEPRDNHLFGQPSGVLQSVYISGNYIIKSKEF